MSHGNPRYGVSELRKAKFIVQKIKWLILTAKKLLLVINWSEEDEYEN